MTPAVPGSGPTTSGEPPLTARSVDLDGDALVIEWADRQVTRLDLVELRRACPCAHCTELRAGGDRVWPKPGDPVPLAVEGAELIGAWGLSLRWNDHHELGIYPWDMLHSFTPG